MVCVTLHVVEMTFLAGFESHSLRHTFNNLQTNKSQQITLDQDGLGMASRTTFEWACAISSVTTSP
jgi:hypothetical protein